MTLCFELSVVTSAWLHMGKMMREPTAVSWDWVLWSGTCVLAALLTPADVQQRCAQGSCSLSARADEHADAVVSSRVSACTEARGCCKRLIECITTVMKFHCRQFDRTTVPDEVVEEGSPSCDKLVSPRPAGGAGPTKQHFAVGPSTTTECHAWTNPPTPLRDLG